jgi:O-antigen/teichoic acid export membrane protein
VSIKKNINTVLKDVYNKGFFHLFSANSLIHLIEFGSQFIVAWILLADDIGRIKSFQSFTAVAVVIAGLGFNSSILKLCAEKNRTLIEKQILFSSAIKITLIFSFITVGIIFILSSLGLVSNDSLTNKFFIYYALSIPLVALNNLVIGYFQALKAFKEISLLLLISKVIHVLIILAATYFYGLFGFVLGLVSGYLIGISLLLYKTDFLVGWNKTTKVHFKENWDLAKFAFSANAVNILTLFFDMFLLNHLVTDAEELGYYGFALTLIAGLRILTTTIQQFVTPFFSEFSHDFQQSMRAFKRANKMFMLVILGAGVCGGLILPYIIQFVYGGKYDGSISYFQLLTIVWVIRSLPSLKGPYLLATGYIKVIFYSVLLVFAISVIPYWYLVKTYGIDGALYGQFFTAIVFFIVITISFHQTIKKISKDSKNLN